MGNEFRNFVIGRMESVAVLPDTRSFSVNIFSQGNYLKRTDYSNSRCDIERASHNPNFPMCIRESYA